MDNKDAILKHKQLLKEDALYYYLSNQLREIDYELESNKDKIKHISFKQSGLKRAKAELVQLRRSIKESYA